MFKRSRDANEKTIIAALESIGAVVTRMDGVGVPDLLVGYRGRTVVVEVKNPASTSKGRGNVGKIEGDHRGQLTDTQVKWWQAWVGGEAYIVTTAEEAVAIARGVEVHDHMRVCATADGVIVDIGHGQVRVPPGIADAFAGALHEQAGVARALAKDSDP